MSTFINITPDKNPDGTALTNPGITIGTRYFYFTFTSPTPSVGFYLRRNRYYNEEAITRIFTRISGDSHLITKNVSNVISPCTFTQNQISLLTPAGYTYTNTSITPNFILNNLVPGTEYVLESKTIYNDAGVDFGVSIKSKDASGALTVLPLTYIDTSPTQITPTIPLPPSPPPSPPSGAPLTPTGLTATPLQFGILLQWSISTDASSYNIYKEGLYMASSSSLSYIDPYTISGSPYSYSITAKNSYGESAKTASVSAISKKLFNNLTQNISGVQGSPQYYYHLFTPITYELDVFMCSSGLNDTAIIGLYDTTAPQTNILTTAGRITNLDSNTTFGLLTIGGSTFTGIKVSTSGQYINTSTKSNFRINSLTDNLAVSTGAIKTYILEVITVKNSSATDISYIPDLGAYMRNVSSNTELVGFTTPLLFNSQSSTRSTPKPYVLSFNFTGISGDIYDKYVYPNLYIFQNAKIVVENIIIKTYGERLTGRTNDMLVNFSIANLDPGTIGQSSLRGWTQNSAHSPDFTYEQDITFSIAHFDNGYFTKDAKFNGSYTVNSHKNLAIFNTLLHEIIHGIGQFYISSYNTTSIDVGWNPFLTNLSENNPWYKGPQTSWALQTYRAYCNNPSLQRIPVEKNYGEGTALSHWDEGDTPDTTNEYRYFNSIFHPSFRYELMTGFSDNNEFMTGLTAGFLKDYGYTVNLNSLYVVAYPASLIPDASGTIAAVTEASYHTSFCRCKTYKMNDTVIHKIMETHPEKKLKPVQYIFIRSLHGSRYLLF